MIEDKPFLKATVFILLPIISVFVLMVGCNNTADVFQQYATSIKPVKLGEGTLSTDSIQWNNVFVPKTKELFYTKNKKTGSIIKKVDLIDGKFKNNQKVDFPEGSSHSDIYLNQDGNIILFSSLMAESSDDTISDWNIWKSVKKDNKWQSPQLFFKTNLEGNQFYPWLTDSGNLYFSSTPHGSRNSDLFVAEYKNGAYLKPKALPKYINSVALEGDAFVAPDESYLIFAGFERGQNLGKSDLYISFSINGHWTTPVWLGKNLNSDGYDGSPFVTHDGKYLIFTSSRGSTDENTFFNHYIISFNPENYNDTALTLTNYLENIGKSPQRFEVDNITTSGIEYGGSLSLKTNEIVFTRTAHDFSSRSMMISSFKDGKFSLPQKMKIGNTPYNGASDVQLSKDGEYLYFKMRGHIPNDSLRNDGNIWRGKRVGDKWSNAELLPPTVNSKLSEYYPMSTNSGNLYFSREHKDTSYDIYVSKYINGKYQEAEPLPDYINTELLESDAYVSPDESYMIFVRMYAEGDLGVSDLYISFNEAGTWSVPKNMRSLNSKGFDGSPFVTSGGEFLFFTSTRDSDSPEEFDGHLDIYVAKFNIKDWK
jgi:hypothetical protein